MVKKDQGRHRDVDRVESGLRTLDSIRRDLKRLCTASHEIPNKAQKEISKFFEAWLSRQVFVGRSFVSHYTGAPSLNSISYRRIRSLSSAHRRGRSCAHLVRVKPDVFLIDKRHADRSEPRASTFSSNYTPFK
ncbi:hypothetical protein EVAR_98302_1 [Eumeta japonica]|uniref:Uncharacterized protein n=1 Tax=Eumeta variegata TaxID=151549 RepID=A0A4C1X9F5_EUMVA|nr:hypothetical protein EVAR_98302_1 [Eumeta japonica]